MKEIPLTQGKVALVDDSDYEWLNQWKWHAAKGGRGWYAIHTIRVNGKRFTQHMPALILPIPKGLLHDHINGNGLDNRRCNLRVCTRSENAQNQQAQRNKKYSNFKGVSCQASRWIVSLRFNSKKVFIGNFTSEIQAALAYDKAAKKYFGEFARTNFIEV